MNSVMFNVVVIDIPLLSFLSLSVHTHLYISTISHIYMYTHTYKERMKVAGQITSNKKVGRTVLPFRKLSDP